MNQCRPCGCKGIRTCLICEKEYGIRPNAFFSELMNTNIYNYCCKCQKAWREWDSGAKNDHCNHSGESLCINGIFVLPDFITEAERVQLLKGMNNEIWDFSQSGRRKQNYGPKCNFKKKKIQLGNFNGFPSYSKLVHDKFKSHAMLENFKVIEQCSLEYDPKRGASIDPHIDDCWIWGERIVTVNVLGDTYLCFTKYKGGKNKYNLDIVESYPCVLHPEKGYILKGNQKNDSFKFDCDQNDKNQDAIIRVFMPEKSLIILYGSARYEWEHFILREDIKNLRICLAYREFTPPYLPGGEKANIGADILKMAYNYW